MGVMVSVLVAALVGVPMAGRADAASTQTFTPTQDSYVSSSEPARNFGTRTTLRTDGSPDIRSYLRFDTSTVGDTVSGATLRIFANSSNSIGIDARPVTDNTWSETGLNFNNQPGMGTVVGSSGRISGGNWFDIPLPKELITTPTFNIGMSSPSSTATSLASRESGASAPQLIVTTGGGGGGDTSPPSAPTGLSATAVSATRIDLSWTASNDDVGIAGYDIFRGGELLDSTGGATNHTDTTVAPSTTYSYQVRARDAAGNPSPLSNTAQATTPASSASTYVVSRGGNTYSASGPGRTYTGSAVSVVMSAVGDLNSGGGGTVQFAAGTFDLGTGRFDLDNIHNVAFVGQGIDVTIIQNNTNASMDTEPFDFNGAFGVTIRDMTVAARGAFRSTSDVIDFDDGNDSLVERVKVTASRARGIIFDGKGPAVGRADNNIVRDCIVTGVPSDGIELLAANNNLVEGCTITDVGGHGIQITKASSSASQRNKQSNDNVIRANTIDEAGQDGININSSARNQITGNTVTNSSDAVSGRSGIKLNSADSISCDDNQIEANTATDNQAVKTQRYGLDISSPNCHRTVVKSTNNFVGNLTGPIRDAGTGTRFV